MKHFLLYSAGACFLSLFVAASAYASNLAGQSCDALGTTQLADDKASIVACLQTGSTDSALVWKSMTPLVSTPNGDLRVGSVNPKANAYWTYRGALDDAKYYGRALVFSGGPYATGWDSDNSDEMFIARYNSAANFSELRVSIGDDAVNYGWNVDKFVVGAYDCCENVGTWMPRVTVTSDGNVGIGTTSPQTDLHLKRKVGGWGSALLEGNSLQTGAPKLLLSDNTNGGLLGTPLWYLAVGDTAPGYPTPDALTIGRAPYFQNPYEIPFLTINNVGNVGIGTHVPQYALHVNGTAYATGVAGALSDERHKTDVKALSLSGLDTVAGLRPVTFKWKEPKDDGMKGEQIGFIAQEVEKVLPQAVMTQGDAAKTKGLKYDELIPVLTKAIQEMAATVDNLKEDNKKLRQEVAALRSVVEETRRVKP